MQLSQHEKYLLNFFFHFLNFDWILNIFEIKMSLLDDLFLNLRTLKDMVKKISLKSPVSAGSSTSNIVDRLKHCSKLNDSTFTIFIDPCYSNSGWKSLYECYSKSSDCLLTHSLPITRFLFLIEIIFSNIFRCNYLRHEKYFLNFFLHFPNFD